MPHRDLLHLDPAPTSAGRARSVVTARLQDLGRDDLVDSASLVVSELVTNALLHAGDRITLRVRGTARRPRIEVGDSSMTLPRLPAQVTREAATGLDDLGPADAAVLGEDVLVTFGRGVRLVQIHSVAWGVDRSTGSKIVWFEPSPSPTAAARNEIQVYEIGDDDSPTRSSATSVCPPHPTRPSDPVPVALINAPVELIASIRRHYDELQREIRLIGLQHGTREPVMRRELFDQAAHPDRHRLRAIGTEQLVAAVEAGHTHHDLEYQVTPADADEFARSVDLLMEADDFCRREQLLTLALSEEMLRALRWYADQITRQVAGGDPTPWSDDLPRG